MKWVPAALAARKLVTLSFSGAAVMSIQKSEGQNASFRCSQTDSLVAEKVPTAKLRPDQSKVKCRALPKKIMNNVPTISTARTLRLVDEEGIKIPDDYLAWLAFNV